MHAMRTLLGKQPIVQKFLVEGLGEAPSFKKGSSRHLTGLNAQWYHVVVLSRGPPRLGQRGVVEFDPCMAYDEYLNRMMTRQERTVMEGNRESRPTPFLSFDVDGMLGGLAKWLRIVGFDVAFPCPAPEQGRFFVTAVRSKRGSSNIVVSSSEPVEQLREVLEQTEIHLDPDLLFSRCIICNEIVVEVPKQDVEGSVPEEVFRSVSSFQQCPVCGRVYWDGSHLERVRKRLAGIGLTCE